MNAALTNSSVEKQKEINLWSQMASKTEVFKWIALLTMTIDHIGYVFFPEHFFLRIIGRLAYPLFALGLIIGMHYTKDKKRYFLRMVAFFVVSQLPFMMAFDTTNLNVFGGLLLGLLTIDAIERRKIALIPIYVILSLWLPVDYGWLNTLWIGGTYHLFKEWQVTSNRYGSIWILLYGLVCFSLFAIYYQNVWLAFAVVGIAIWLYSPFVLTKRLPKYFLYIYYPAHLSIFALLKTFF